MGGCPSVGSLDQGSSALAISAPRRLLATFVVSVRRYLVALISKQMYRFGEIAW